MRSGLLAGIRWSVYILKSHRSLCESFSRTGARLCIYYLFVWSNWNSLHISQWITLPTHSFRIYLSSFHFSSNIKAPFRSPFIFLVFIYVIAVLVNPSDMTNFTFPPYCPSHHSAGILKNFFPLSVKLSQVQIKEKMHTL